MHEVGSIPRHFLLWSIFMYIHSLSLGWFVTFMSRVDASDIVDVKRTATACAGS